MVKEVAQQVIKARQGSGSVRVDEVESMAGDLIKALHPCLYFSRLFHPCMTSAFTASIRQCLKSQYPVAHLMCPFSCQQSASCIDPLHDKRLLLLSPGNAQRNSAPSPTHSAPFPVLQSASCIDPLHDKRFCSLRPVLSKVHLPHHSLDVPLFLRFSPPSASTHCMTSALTASTRQCLKSH